MYKVLSLVEFLQVQNGLKIKIPLDGLSYLEATFQKAKGSFVLRSVVRVQPHKNFETMLKVDGFNTND